MKIIVEQDLLQQAEDALCYCATAGIRVANVSDSINALRTALETAEKAEPLAWMWQHDETGQLGFIDGWQVENCWQQNNPRLHLVRKLYAAPVITAGDERQHIICVCPDCLSTSVASSEDAKAEREYWTDRIRQQNAAINAAMVEKP